MAGFLFGGNTGETAESLARKRAVAEALLADANSRVPQSIGEGISSVAQALSGRLGLNALQKKQEAGSAALDAKIKSYWGGADAGSPIPSPDAAAEVSAADPGKVDMTGNQVYSDFINTVKEGVKNPYALAAIAATGKAESDFSPGNVNRTWDDPSESGKPGRAGGIMSWRGPRYEALAATGDLSPAGQAKFFLQEDPNLIASLNNAKSVEEAQSLMNRAWAFRGYDKPGGEAARRLSLATSFLPEFQGQGGGTQVASLDPAAGMPAPDASAAIAATAPASGYVDPKVTTAYRQPSPAVVAALAPGNSQMTAQPSPVAAALAAQPADNGQPLPPLPRTDVAPAPTVAGVPDQKGVSVAQALSGKTPAPPVPGAVDPRYLEILSDPYITPGQAAVVRSMMQSDQARQQAAYDAWLKQNDPAYQAGLAKTKIELDNLKNPKISPADQERIDLERQKFDFERNKPTEVNGRLIGPDGKVVYESPRDPMKVGAKETVIDPTSGKVIYQPAPGQAVDFSDVSSLRKEIQQLPSYKNLSQALPIYRSMAETAGRSSKASDLNLVYGLGKIMDPTSVVREGEMTMVKSTASWPDWLQGALASLNGGAALTPETRQAIMTEAYGRVKGYDSAFKQDTGQYQGIVERNKFNPADVIPDFGTYEPWKPAAPNGTTSTGTKWSIEQ
ncbi:hypothetical protein FHX08_004772 [Rhizobium sp. BK529]|uniref:hypothetical protein n=1 Tax=Rhizobium sp. BK529 TaxID=2586983 RepID=UPI00161F75BE|nr:hypothetical protein [Rhizobium sp. BK529]MBB3594368.1 hypothetical protein [Rhizobium sp. BK529]